MRSKTLSTPLLSAALLVTSIVSGSATAQAQSSAPEAGEAARSRSPNNPLVALRDIESRRPSEPRPDRGAAVFPEEFRTIDGLGNNAANPDWGTAGATYLRLTTVAYEDDSSSPSGLDRPSARHISNSAAAQTGSIPNTSRASDFVWQWGQFLDHDLDLTPEVHPEESHDIQVPAGDPWFDPQGTGTATIPLNRSVYAEVDGVRQQINTITAFIDASNVYGSDQERADALRVFDGTGRLETSDGNFLPFNDEGLPNAATGAPGDFFLAGDFRANEQVALTAMHTLFLREHNFWATRLGRMIPELDGDAIYEYAKAIVTAEMQKITYQEFLPILLGPNTLAPYRGYRPGVHPGISNLFAGAAYRFGHSMLSPQLLRLDSDGQEIEAGNLSLANAFFNPTALTEGGIEPILRGLATQTAQEIDTRVVDEVRNFLFGPPGSGGFDLASLNIQRGRDHGLPSFNQLRRDLGLRPYRRFGQFHPNPEVAARLRSSYETVEDVDAWVGGLAEVHRSGALVGETWRTVLADQFQRLRDGDRFWYQSYLPDFMVELVEQQSLARIIRRNTDIGREIPNNPFRIAPSP